MNERAAMVIHYANLGSGRNPCNREIWRGIVQVPVQIAEIQAKGEKNASCGTSDQMAIGDRCLPRYANGRRDSICIA